jgi:alpha-L-rhamnosidase N-terminal domain./bacterial alpha-L-rhamnosidase
MRAEQSILEGSVPNVVPRLKRGMVAEHGSSPWADAGVIIPWNVYMHYGNRTLLNECYEGMKAWVDYERKKEEELGGPHLIKDGFHFADWLALDNDAPGPFGATNPLFVASAYYYKNASILSESARVLGNLEDEKIYGDLAKEILSAIRITYYNEEGLCICNTQTGSAISIMFRLNPSEEARIMEGAALVAKINANNGYLNTGFVGTNMLCPALTETGHSNIAINLLLNEEYPGWLYSVKMGATTIWERWNSVMPDGHINEDGMNSLNHYAYGSIEAWMYGYVCGIKPKEPGFKKAIIEPHPDKRLGHASCNLDTAFGRYYVAWRYDGDMVIYELDIPFDTIAEFRCEGIDSKILKAGKYTFRTR